jgi:hypothetical protein
VRAHAGLSREQALAAVLASANQLRLLTPLEVADAALALCSPDSGAANGRSVLLHPVAVPPAGRT